MNFASKNNGDLREEIGWDELVKTVAGIRDSLPAEQRENVGVRGRKLRRARGDRDTGSGLSLASADQRDELGMAARVSCASAVDSDRDRLIAQLYRADIYFVPGGGAQRKCLGVHNEESEDHPDIYVCGGLRLPWPEFWKEFQAFG